MCPFVASFGRPSFSAVCRCLFGASAALPPFIAAPCRVCSGVHARVFCCCRSSFPSRARSRARSLSRSLSRSPLSLDFPPPLARDLPDLQRTVSSPPRLTSWRGRSHSFPLTLRPRARRPDCCCERRNWQRRRGARAARSDVRLKAGQWAAAAAATEQRRVGDGWRCGWRVCASTLAAEQRTTEPRGNCRRFFCLRFQRRRMRSTVRGTEGSGEEKAKRVRGVSRNVQSGRSKSEVALYRVCKSAASSSRTRGRERRGKVCRCRCRKRGGGAMKKRKKQGKNQGKKC